MFEKEEIFKIMKNRTVLHVGAIGDFSNHLKNLKRWDFDKIKRIAKETTGIDINKKFIEKVKEKEYNILFHDAENIDLKKSFDIIYAGDLIEHLSNPGKFLASCFKHMHNDSVLIITRPNPYSLSLLIRGLMNKVSPMREHTMYIHRDNLKEIAKRYNLKLTRTEYYTEKNKDNPIKNRIYRLVTSLFYYYGEEQAFFLQRK